MTNWADFMVPENRGCWGERRVRELLGQLFGWRIALGEHVELDGDDGEEVLKEGYLRLSRVL